MKKYIYSLITLILIASTLVFFNQAYASTLVASYPSSNYGSDATMYNGSFIAFGQDFLVSQYFLTLNNASFYIKKSGSPTGNVYAYLYAITGTYGTNAKPTGTPLATSTALDVSTLTTSYQTITFNFTGTNQVALANGTYYYIVISYTGGDSSDKVEVGGGFVSPVGDVSFLNGSGWGYNNNYNPLIFSVYADSSAPTSSGGSNNLMMFE